MSKKISRQAAKAPSCSLLNHLREKNLSPSRQAAKLLSVKPFA